MKFIFIYKNTLSLSGGGGGGCIFDMEHSYKQRGKEREGAWTSFPIRNLRNERKIECWNYPVEEVGRQRGGREGGKKKKKSSVLKYKKEEEEEKNEGNYGEENWGYKYCILYIVYCIL